MIDFDNKNIGGGVWEEICTRRDTFLYIVELLITMCVSFQLNDKEATAIYERLSSYLLLLRQMVTNFVQHNQYQPY